MAASEQGRPVTKRPLWDPASDREEIVSYSQNAEDIRLWRIFRDALDGFYVDVGAGDPVEYSVTKLFSDRGWTGINIEPGPAFVALEADRTRDVNLRLAVGPIEEVRDFWVSSPHPGLSTFYAPQADEPIPDGFRFERVTVKCKPLAQILADHARGRDIAFMNIDAEGAEGEVIHSIDFESSRPRVLVIESVAPLTLEPSHEEWEPLLLEVGYEFATFDGLNRFYVEHDHAELIPILAYPISVFDRFVTALARDREATADERVRQAEVERDSVTARLDHTLRELGDQVDRSRSLRRSLDATSTELVATREELSATSAELAATRAELSAVYASPTWRAGRLVAWAGRPALRAARRVRARRPPSGRKLGPRQAYSAAIARGQPWHFAQQSGRSRNRRGGASLSGLLRLFGEPHVAVDVNRAAEIAERIDQVGWCNEDLLLARHLSWEERQAVVEVDAVVQFVRGASIGSASLARKPTSVGRKPAVVIDARCLQNPVYATRGVGLHSRTVLHAVRAAAADKSLVLLTDADLPALPDDMAGLADHIVATPYAVRGANVVLFLQLSPMTATCAAAMPFLAEPTCATASVVYDFIPTLFPGAYLRSTASALENRSRIEALRHYDLLLPISESTKAECQRILGERPDMPVTGVGDPLHEVRPKSPVADAPFMLVPAGGDSRKNIPAAVAALARHCQAGGDGPLRAVITGAMTSDQASALVELANQTGLPSDGLELRGSVGAAELAGLYAAADLTFVASLTEGFSIPVAEAVVRNTPVVASDIPAHRELVGVGAWLAPGTDVEALANAISFVRRESEAVVTHQRAALGDTADPPSVVERIASALEPLLERPQNDRHRPTSDRAQPRIAVVSPFPPQRSGVADYTAFTFRQVAQYADVEVYSPTPSQVSGPYSTHRLSSAPYLSRRLDAVVNVIGNSHFHFPILNLLSSYGGATIAHDNRMLEAYRYDRGEAWTAALLSLGGTKVGAPEIDEFMLDLDRLPSIGYDVIARQASPLIVHGSALASRIFRETGVSPVVVPFVPYNVPVLEAVDDDVRARCREALELADDVVHIATFGIVDSRTKRTDLVIGAVAWLRDWGRPAHLHIVGDTPAAERRSLQNLVGELGVAAHVTLHGHVTAQALNDFLLAVDVAVQLRTSALLSLSGALADCIAFGIPTVTTRDIAEEMEAPPYVVTTGSATSSLLIAEALEELANRRQQFASMIEAERRDYLARRSVDAYATQLLAGLGLWSE